MRRKPIVKVKVKKKVPAKEIVAKIQKLWKGRFRIEKNTLYYENKKKKVSARWTVTSGRVIRLYQKLEIPPAKKGDKDFAKKMFLNKKYMLIRTLVTADLMKHPKKLRREIYELEKILEKRYGKKVITKK